MESPEPTLGAEHLLPYEGGPKAGVQDLIEAIDDDESEADTDTADAVAEVADAQEPEEPEQDADDDADDDIEDDEEDAGEQPPLYKVKVDGQEFEVTLEEALKGYQRFADYTRKTTEVAKIRRKADADKESYATRLEAFGALAGDRFTPEEQHAIQQEYVAIRSREAHQAEEERAARVAQESERLAEVLPEWREPEKATAEKKALVQYADSVGYSPEEVQGITDHRAIVVLRKAMLYDQMQGEGRENVRRKAKAAPVLQPGGRAPASPQARNRKAMLARMERAAQTGRTSDAAAALEGLID